MDIRPTHAILASAYAITITWAGAVWHMHAPGDAHNIKTALGFAILTPVLVAIDRVEKKGSTFVHILPIPAFGTLAIGCFLGWKQAEASIVTLGFLTWIGVFLYSFTKKPDRFLEKGWVSVRDRD